MIGQRSGRTRAIGIALASMLALTAACGSDDDNDDTSTDSTESPETTAGGGSTTTAGSDGGEGDDAAWDAIVEAANEEGEVQVVTTFSPPQIALLEEAFEEAYPDIDAVITNVTTGDQIARGDAESTGRSTGADVFQHGDITWFTNNSQGDRFADLEGPNFANPEVEERNAGFNGKATAVYYAVFGYVWNPGAVEGDPPTFEFVSGDDSMRGRLALFDYATIPQIVIQYRLWEEQYGEEFLEQLADMEPRFYAGSLALVQAVAAGEVDGGIGVSPGSPRITPIAYTPDSMAVPQSSAVSALAPHPNAAQVFANFLVSEDFQPMLADDFETTPLLSSANEGGEVDLDETRILTAEDYEPTALNEYREKLNGIFGR